MVFAPYADLIWLETKTPDIEQARAFARKIREKFPGKWFVYNLSPSFNWSAHGFTGGFHAVSVILAGLCNLTDCGDLDTDLKNFIWDLAKEGYVILTPFAAPW